MLQLVVAGLVATGWVAQLFQQAWLLYALLVDYLLATPRLMAVDLVGE